MDHFGWIIVAVVAIGWGAQVVRVVRRFAAKLQAASTAASAPASAAELARGRAPLAPPAPARPSPPAPARPNPPVSGAPIPRTTSPTRRVPLGGTPAGAGLGLAGVLDPFEPKPSMGGRALADALRTGPGLRNAVVLAEVLAPPVALR